MKDHTFINPDENKSFGLKYKRPEMYSLKLQS